jgi:TRAP transporter 4TM/12TM fusion protein
MIRFGYRPAFAGAVEATAAMGGQIMPPVMGAVAFIMAETINVPYVEICIAAAIPALLYYAAAFAVVHFEAGLYGLKGLPKEQRPNVRRALRERWHLLIPLAGLIYLIFGGYTPLFAGTVSLAITVMFILGSVTSARLPNLLARLVFWVAVGVAAALLFDLFNITALFVMAALLAVAAAAVAVGRGSLMMCIQALSDGARAALPVGIACALVGVLIGIMQLTGLGSTLSRIVLDQAGHSLFLTLFYTMIISIILGTGLPTIPTYIITASMAAPILLQFKIPLIVSHMFVFYFGIMADLTPPVALAAFAASVIAKADAQKIGWIATRIAIAGYIIPFMAVYDSSLMLQSGTWLDTIYVTIKALVALIFWGAAMTGWLKSSLNVAERVFMVGSSCLLVASIGWLDELGLALSAGFVIWHWWRSRSAPAAPSRA